MSLHLVIIPFNCLLSPLYNKHGDIIERTKRFPATSSNHRQEYVLNVSQQQEKIKIAGNKYF